MAKHTTWEVWLSKSPGRRGRGGSKWVKSCKAFVAVMIRMRGQKFFCAHDCLLAILNQAIRSLIKALFVILPIDRPVQFHANNNPLNFLRILRWLKVNILPQKKKLIRSKNLSVHPMIRHQRNALLSYDRGISLLVASLQNNLNFWKILVLVSLTSPDDYSRSRHRSICRKFIYLQFITNSGQPARTFIM